MAARYPILLMLLVWPAVSAAAILNPSFEQYRSVTPYPDTVPRYWDLRNMDSTLFGSQYTGVWKTDGLYSEGLYSRFGRTFTPGEYQGVFHTTDLTEVGSIIFDAQLTAYGSTFDNFEASFLVDGVVLWTATEDGTYSNQQVNVSRFSGFCDIEFRITARTAGQFNMSCFARWDNLRTMAKPAETIVDATVDLDPDTLDLNSSGKWITGYITLPDGYDVEDIDGSTVTLEGISAHIGQEGWATAEASAGNIVDHDGDGVQERMVKFDRAAVQAIVTAGDAAVTVEGKLAEDVRLRATAVIRVIDKGNGKKG